MTLRSTLLLLFPGLVLGLALAGLITGAWVGGATGAGLSVAWILAAIYLLPVLCYRLHNALWPVEPGGSYLIGEAYSPWWGGHQLQLIYLAAPWLEGLLRLIPGLYSAWLRLWGSTVGKSVYWTPQVEIGDRGLMIIGDQVIFGHRAVAFDGLGRRSKFRREVRGSSRRWLIDRGFVVRVPACDLASTGRRR